MADWLDAAGYTVTTAADGATALQLIEQQWFPVVVSDWQMPVMNGIQLAERLRNRGMNDSYFIMLSARSERTDFERGYAAGVDDYLAKKSNDPELLSRINAGLQTVELRLRLRESHESLQADKNAASAANDRLQLLSRLQTEIARARRYRRPCSLLMLGPQAPVALLAPQPPATLLDAVRKLLRADIDWASTYTDADGNTALAVVLPETSAADTTHVLARLQQGLSDSMRRFAGGDSTLHFGIDAVTLDVNDYLHTSAESMLSAAKHLLDSQTTWTTRAA